ncbi:MAG: hypothetical protein BJ554DRAFT_4904 [Olpidium bornovanus]|uniref:Periodic tryptophan protein 1 n=1 Tax=Olpidium bornovanus TaxID=278681 RepID=A0A8H8DF64_9FUNG|nr:MAG: hypothetical protein BJ554DRAFT_4904 [Olpidium bornovanus]
MISAVAWVKKGAAQRVPDSYEMSDEDLAHVHQLTAKELAAAREEYRRATGADVQDALLPPAGAADAPSDMDDDEEDSDAVEDNSLFARVKGLAYYNGNEEDPYITFRTPTGAPQKEALTAEEEELHRADLEVLPTDNLLLAARTEDDVSHLEVCVYEGEDVGNLYVRHDVMLPAFPLCLEWLDFRVGRKRDLEGGGNYVAVGTFDPEIEIWDLDTTDAMYPDAILGRATAQEETCATPSKGEKKKKNKKKKKKAVSSSANKERHVDAVLGLAWNHNHR